MASPNGNGKHPDPSAVPRADRSADHAFGGNNGPLATLRGILNPSHVRYAHITGWGMKVPDRVIANADLEALVETTDEWIRSRTGIHERRMASDRESVATLGFEAARAALDRADVLPRDLDLIIVATSTPEDFYPSTASKVQNLLGATRAGAFDLSAACAGFIYGLNMAAQAIRSGSIERALVIGSEVNTRVLDWHDRSTCVLFGDGAGAVLLEGSDTPGGLLTCVLGSDGSGADLLGIPTVGRMNLPEGQKPYRIHMDGREVFRFAVRIINESVREALGRIGLGMDEVNLIIPHQANQRIISAAAQSLDVPESMFYMNVHRYGNTSSASIPIALCEAEKEGRLKPNDNVVMVGFGGGLTWGAAVIKWQAEPPRALGGLGYRLGQGRREVEYIAAFWRARVLQAYRRAEASLSGSPLKVKNWNKRKAVAARRERRKRQESEKEDGG